MHRILNLIKKNYLWLIISICLIIIFSIVEDVYEKEIMKCDTILYNLFVATLRSSNLTTIMKIITMFGNASILIGITIILAILIRNKRISLCLIGNIILVSLLNLFLKSIIQRPRPTGYRLIVESGYSLPSGHAMISTAVYGFIIYLIYKYISNNKVKWPLIIFLIILILLIGCSRVYLGVHYASDIIAGYSISLIYLIIYIKLLKYSDRANQ